LRGGAGTAKFARFAPALGDIALDGTMRGWESAEPVKFSADKNQTVEVRCLYRPGELLLRWHARLGTKFIIKPQPPLERVFTHDQLTDTLSFYFGDERIVFGIFQGGATFLSPQPSSPSGDKNVAVPSPQPVAVGFYTKWSGPGQPQVYRTPVGETKFAHVGPVADAKLAHTIDADGKGFVFVAAIPTKERPLLVNFSATYAGHNKFWWANSDGSASRETYDEPTEARLYPGSWAPAQFADVKGGVTVRHWQICGPFGGPGAEKFKPDPRDAMKDAVKKFSEAATYPPDTGKLDLTAKFNGEMIRGYWPDPREVRWKPATVADLDTRVVLGPSAQVWYGATWIHVPADTELEFKFQGRFQTTYRWFLNGEPVTGLKFSNERQSVASKTLTLRSGWNEIKFRGYCIGYPPFRAGLVLDGPTEKLWNLTLSAVPPL
jgi:hypothetical protein